MKFWLLSGRPNVPGLWREVGYEEPTAWADAKPRLLKTRLPDFATAMDFSYTVLWFPQELDRARVDYLKDRNRLAEAEKWQEQLFDDESKVDPASAHRELRPAIEMLMKLGRTDEARKMQRKELQLAAQDTIPAERARAQAHQP